LKRASCARFTRSRVSALSSSPFHALMTVWTSRGVSWRASFTDQTSTPTSVTSVMAMS
jgi:hypothetical protein